ncbi:uncharacterized membrane protein YgdD (TMEM256/DUF423 family) [Nitrospina gracilis]|nr:MULTISPECIES: DUF423 domain-containing protein [Nitrospina]MCF8724669.1 uncharacterized membrane protein YgdD (TMEM256/DUF423 family) [Nitrospina sp. Nb-3]
MRRWILIGSILGGLSVMLGAFGAHSLKAVLTEKSLATFQTANQYQFFHSLALVLVGLLCGYLGEGNDSKANKAGWFFLAGIVMFSGSLYWLALGGPRVLGPVTPLGGLSFMIGWFLLAFSFPKK